MPIEQFTTSYDYSEYENFGWKLVKTETNMHTHRSGRHHYTKRVTSYVLQRDTDMPNYKLIKAYEDKYFYIKSQYKYYKKADVDIAILLFLILIVPGIIYLSCKSLQKQRINEHNARITNEMKDILTKTKELL